MGIVRIAGTGICALYIGFAGVAAGQEDAGEPTGEAGEPAPAGGEADAGDSGTTEPSGAPAAQAGLEASISLAEATYPPGLLPADWEDPSTYEPAVSSGPFALVARGYEGLAILARAPDGATRQLALVGQGLDIEGVRWVGDAALARTRRGEALLLDVQDPAFPRVLLLLPAGAREDGNEGIARRSRSDVPLPPERIEGAVVEVRGGHAVIDRGSDHGLGTGMHMRVESLQPIKVRDMDSGQTVTRPSGEILAVAEVVEVSAGRAKLALGPGDDARVGDRVVSCGETLTADWATPTRTGGMLTIEGAIRPFLGVNTLAFGMINDLRVSYRFGVPFKLTLALDPFGLVVGRDGSGLPGHAGVIGALDADYFGFGFGVGYAWSLAKQTGVSFRQGFRFGAYDGVMFEGSNEFILALPTPEGYDGPTRSEAEFIWGGARGIFRWPTGPRSRMALEGGGAVNGYAFGLLDLYVALAGTGGPGTFWLRVGGGVGWLWDNPAEHSMPSGNDGHADEAAGFQLSAPQIGPVFGVGFEWHRPTPVARP